jgi:hypothetical protein
VHSTIFAGKLDAGDVWGAPLAIFGAGIVERMPGPTGVEVPIEGLDHDEGVGGDMSGHIPEVVELLALSERIILAAFPEERPLVFSQHVSACPPERCARAPISALPRSPRRRGRGDGTP